MKVNKSVCKKALCSLYQIGRKKVDIVKSNVKKGLSAPPLDERGKHENRPHKMYTTVSDYIIKHIKVFPAEYSHYSRD